MAGRESVNIAVFVSGNGTNCENLIRHFDGNSRMRVSLVLSNRAGAYALERARRLGVRTEVVSRDKFGDPEVLLPLLEKYRIDFIVLAGFLQMIPGWLVREYDRRMINLHPSLLPKYGGKGMYGRHVHEAVKAACERETGMTVHWVNMEYDKGDIIAQYRTLLSPDDTPDDIASKEHELEIKYFPKVVEEVIEKVFRFNAS